MGVMARVGVLTIVAAMPSSMAAAQERPSVTQEPDATAYDLLVRQAREHLDHEHYREAREACLRAIELDRSRYEAYLTSAMALHGLADTAQALASLEAAERLAPEERRARLRSMRAMLDASDREAEVRRGREALAQGRYALAAECLQRVFERDHSREDAGLSAASAWAAVGEFASAVRLATDLAGSENVRTRDEAQRILADLKPLCNRELAAALARAAELERQGRDQLALKVLESVAEQVPAAVEPHLATAKILAREGEFTRAVQALARAVDRGCVGTSDLLEPTELQILWGHPAYEQLMSAVFGARAVARHRSHAAIVQGLNQPTFEERFRALGAVVVTEENALDLENARAALTHQQRTAQAASQVNALKELRALWKGCELSIPEPPAVQVQLESGEAALRAGDYQLAAKSFADTAATLERWLADFGHRNQNRLSRVLLDLASYPTDRYQKRSLDPAASAIVEMMEQDPSTKVFLTRDGRCLERAVRLGNLALARLLLAHGADPNSPVDEGWSRNLQYSLISAIQAQRPDLVELLLQAGARVDCAASQKSGVRSITPVDAAQTLPSDVRDKILLLLNGRR
jgi:tetratricopeptide (TPR) repeat protein